MINKKRHITRNIRKPGIVGNLNIITFTQKSNDLISRSFEIPASAYYHPLWGIVKETKQHDKKPQNIIDYFDSFCRTDSTETNLGEKSRWILESSILFSDCDFIFLADC